MKYEVDKQILQWPMFGQYGALQVCFIMLMRADAYGRTSVSIPYIESLTGMSYSTIAHIIDRLVADGIVVGFEEDVYAIKRLPDGVNLCGTTEDKQETPHVEVSAHTVNDKPKKEKSMSRGIQRFVKPTVEEVATYISEKGYSFDAETFWNFYDSKGWMIGKNHMKNWHSACATWNRHQSTNTGHERNNYQQQQYAARQAFVNATAQTDVCTGDDSGLLLPGM